ncbi:MAG: class I SAM-dependent methyltransferase [Chloroflexi bacterium]|nr:class I SAM-dependent methyltransferase [Chloroflexota bacterium]
MRVLDVGAGNGWLANQLAARGHRVAAVDLRDDARDGLGARRNYFFAFECYQAEFERLPFAPAQFDLVIFNASLHYAASLAETLQEASRILAPIGKILLVDSPFYSHSITQSPNRPNYFLTFDQLNRTARELNLNIEIIFADAEWHKRARRKIIARKLGREPAHFPIYTLQSPPVP